jgi:hypothetical protein
VYSRCFNGSPSVSWNWFDLIWFFKASSRLVCLSLHGIESRFLFNNSRVLEVHTPKTSTSTRAHLLYILVKSRSADADAYLNSGALLLDLTGQTRWVRQPGPMPEPFLQYLLCPKLNLSQLTHQLFTFVHLTLNWSNI